MANRFVVTHHLATADHFDLRLEIGSTLVSWAVPKGPSTDPAVRRLAIRTDDHGMEHLTPAETGDGRHAVLVWDHGTFDNFSHDGPREVDLKTALERGRLRVLLHGQRLEGRFALVRTDRLGHKTWLLLKTADDDAQPGRDIVADSPTSIVSGRTVEQIRDAGVR